jgi:PGDYG protein
MQEPFEVALADGVSHLSGRAGDWLVDYGDGSLGIVAEGIFATTYAVLS